LQTVPWTMRAREGCPARRRVLADVTSQQPRGPQFVWVSQVFGFLAGQRHQPSLGLWRDVRRLAGAWAVIEPRHHTKARRTAQAALHGLVGHPDPPAHRRRRGFRAVGSRMRARSTRLAGSVRDRASASNRAKSAGSTTNSITRRGAAMNSSRHVDTSAYNTLRDLGIRYIGPVSWNRCTSSSAP
jgi:hypothetical protein